jgi:hypothetical protein
MQLLCRNIAHSPCQINHVDAWILWNEYNPDQVSPTHTVSTRYSSCQQVLWGNLGGSVALYGYHVLKSLFHTVLLFLSLYYDTNKANLSTNALKNIIVQRCCFGIGAKAGGMLSSLFLQKKLEFQSITAVCFAAPELWLMISEKLLGLLYFQNDTWEMMNISNWKAVAAPAPLRYILLALNGALYVVVESLRPLLGITVALLSPRCLDFRKCIWMEHQNPFFPLFRPNKAILFICCHFFCFVLS